MNLKQIFDTNPDIASAWDTEWSDTDKIKFLTRIHPQAKELSVSDRQGMVDKVDKARTVPRMAKEVVSPVASLFQGKSLPEAASSIAQAADIPGRINRAGVMGGNAALSTQGSPIDKVKAFVERAKAGGSSTFQPKPNERMAAELANATNPSAGIGASAIGESTALAPILKGAAGKAIGAAEKGTGIDITEIGKALRGATTHDLNEFVNAAEQRAEEYLKGNSTISLDPQSTKGALTAVKKLMQTPGTIAEEKISLQQAAETLQKALNKLVPERAAPAADFARHAQDVDRMKDVADIVPSLWKKLTQGFKAVS